MGIVIRQVEAGIAAKRRRFRTVKRADTLIARPTLAAFIAAVAAVLGIALNGCTFAPACNLPFRFASGLIRNTGPSHTDFGRSAAIIATAAVHRIILKVVTCIAAAARRANRATPFTAARLRFRTAKMLAACLEPFSTSKIAGAVRFTAVRFFAVAIIPTAGTDALAVLTKRIRLAMIALGSAMVAVCLKIRTSARAQRRISCRTRRGTLTIRADFAVFTRMTARTAVVDIGLHIDASARTLGLARTAASPLGLANAIDAFFIRLACHFAAFFSLTGLAHAILAHALAAFIAAFLAFFTIRTAHCNRGQLTPIY